MWKANVWTKAWAILLCILERSWKQKSWRKGMQVIICQRIRNRMTIICCSIYRLYPLIALIVHFEHDFQYFLQRYTRWYMIYMKRHITLIIFSNLSVIIRFQAIRLFKRYIHSPHKTMTRLDYHLWKFKVSVIIMELYQSNIIVRKTCLLCKVESNIQTDRYFNNN